MLRKSDITEPPMSQQKVDDESFVSGRLSKSIVVEEVKKQKKSTKKAVVKPQEKQEEKKTVRVKSVISKEIPQVAEDTTQKLRSTSVQKDEKPKKATSAKSKKANGSASRSVNVRVEYCNT